VAKLNDKMAISKEDKIGTCEVCGLHNQKLWRKMNGEGKSILVCFGCIGNYWHDGEK